MAHRSRIYFVTPGVSRSDEARESTGLLSNEIYKRRIRFAMFPGQNGLMLRPLRLLVVLFTRVSRSRREIFLGNLAVQEQLAVFNQRRRLPCRT